MASIDSYKTKKGIRYRVQYRTPDRKLTAKRGFPTKNEARKFAASVEVAVASGSFISPSAGKITIDEVYTAWEPSQAVLAAHTRVTNSSTWRRHVQPYWGQWQVSRITSPEVRKWVSQMVERGHRRDTIKRSLHILKSILDTAVEDRKIAANPVQGIRIPSELKDRRPYLTPAQINHLADGMPTATSRTIIYTMAYCGLRIGELAALDCGDYNSANQRLSITKSRKQDGSVGPTKTHENRHTPVPAFLVGHIESLIGDRPDDEPLFLSPDGVRLDPHNFRNRTFQTGLRCAAATWSKGKHKTPFPRVTPHGLRHTCASLAISSGANVKSVQALLGHRDATVTLNTYADLFPDDLDTVAHAMNQIFTQSQEVDVVKK